MNRRRWLEFCRRCNYDARAKEQRVLFSVGMMLAELGTRAMSVRLERGASA